MFADSSKESCRQVLQLLQLALQKGKLGVDGGFLVDPVGNLEVEFHKLTLQMKIIFRIPQTKKSHNVIAENVASSLLL